MKKILLSLMCIALLMGTTSCKDWLDVNTDPDSPSAETALVEVRLPWIQYYYSYAMGNSNFRVNCTTQMFTLASRSGNYFLTNWDYVDGPSTTAYQNWFTGGASNVPYLIQAAQKEGATHYEAAAMVLKAMGSIMMVDIFGEMPYDESADQSVLAPHYNDGDYTYIRCMQLLQDAIALFSQPQVATATPLSKGDIWLGGDAQKWIKLCNGLLARWNMNLSKMKARQVEVDGEQVSLQFDAAKVRGYLANAPKSASEDLYATYTNPSTASTCYTAGDAYGPNTTWDCAAWGTGQRINRYYVNLLTNFKGTGVEDPRANKLLPSAMYHVRLSDDGSSIVSNEWLRDEGIDEYDIDGEMLKPRHVFGNTNATLTPATADVAKTYTNASILLYYPSVDAFVRGIQKYYSEADATIAVSSDNVTVTYHAGAMYVNDTNPLYVEDIKYVQLACDGLFECGGLSATDVNCYRSVSNATTRALGYVQGTGNFYTRPDSDNDLFTYAEACFIEAELSMLEGNKGGAYTAYINGIKAHFDRMNRKLNEWQGQGSCTTAKGFDVSFAYAPIPQADIDAYMKSAAVCQSSGEISMSHIMMQKLIAMGPHTQNWNDMRKYNYYRDGVYTEMKVPAYRPGSNYEWVNDPSSQRFYPRRWFHSSHENNYNQTNLTASYAKYNAQEYGNIEIIGGRDRKIPSIPVFWDWE